MIAAKSFFREGFTAYSITVHIDDWHRFHPFIYNLSILYREVVFLERLFGLTSFSEKLCYNGM